jgi:hypothetical protein
MTPFELHDSLERLWKHLVLRVQYGAALLACRVTVVDEDAEDELARGALPKVHQFRSDVRAQPPVLWCAMQSVAEGT